MKNISIDYCDGSQKLIGELFYNEAQSDQQSAILLFPAFEGRGDFSLDYAKKLALQGYTVFVADMYGDAKVSHTLEGCFELIAPFLQDRALVRRRAVLAFEALLAQKNINPEKIGAIGFCFGGMCVLELARSGAKLKAGISMHGVLAKSALPTLSIKAKLLILHGFQDPQVPPTQLQSFAEEMAAVDVNDWIFTFFGDTKHSFTDSKTGTFDPEKEKAMGREYNPIVAERSFQYALDFFREFIGDDCKNSSKIR
ncbi:MAG: dienelactone hydrolase family protein [Coxiellaceae bacterium]|nr:dienelactone hydrolase family protein [Coxiellaceae bacterium]